MNIFENAEWIAPPDRPEDVNLYMLFRTGFEWDGSDRVLLRVSAAGNYAAFRGGKLAAFGQYTDFPAHKTYSETDVTAFCVPGRNELEIAAWYSGRCFTSHTEGPEPGLLAETVSGGRTLAASSPSWLCAWDTRYAMGPREKCSGSLNWTFDFRPENMPPRFVHAVELPEECRMKVVKRPVEPPVILERIGGKMIWFRPLFRDAAPLEIGARADADILDPAPGKANGSCVLFDLGKEAAGLLFFEAECGEGTIIDIVHGEYLNDRGRLTAHFPGGRNFADRVRPGAGRFSFRHILRRFGCRYLEFHVIGNGKILSAGLDSVGFEAMRTIPPVHGLGPFWNRARDVSAETLRLCLHEKFENCPWREQSICMYDARNQMLFGYSLWGNYAHARAMLDLFGQSLRPDGYLAVAVPSEAKFNIPSFTFLWFRAMEEYALYSGDLTLFSAYAPQMRRMIGAFLSRGKGGLFMPPAEDLWNYCDPPEMEYCTDPPNAFYNLYLVFALRSASNLFRMTGDAAYARKLEERASCLGSAAEQYFFDPARSAYADHRNAAGEPELFHGHTQMLFLAAGLIPDNRREAVMNTLKSGSVTFPALSALPWLIDGISRFGTGGDRAWLHEKLKSIYGAMLDAGAQTWWEVSLGSAYGAGAGSLCHGWSAVPAYYIASHLLGIRPLEPGFRRFEVEPYLPEMENARGSVRTPFGLITVELAREPGGAVRKKIVCPPECAPAVRE